LLGKRETKELGSVLERKVLSSFAWLLATVIACSAASLSGLLAINRVAVEKLARGDRAEKSLRQDARMVKNLKRFEKAWFPVS
jgi:hypothetical protein